VLQGLLVGRVHLDSKVNVVETEHVESTAGLEILELLERLVQMEL